LAWTRTEVVPGQKMTLARRRSALDMLGVVPDGEETYEVYSRSLRYIHASALGLVGGLYCQYHITKIHILNPKDSKPNTKNLKWKKGLHLSQI
jgi:hypothetical protein